MTNILNYQHFPVYSVMVLFLGAFLIVMFGKYKTFRNIVAFLAVSISLACMVYLVKPVMLEGEIINYWMGSRSMAGGYAIGIAMEVDALSLVLRSAYLNGGVRLLRLLLQVHEP